MADDMDIVQGINEQFQTAALEEHQRNRPTGPAATHCEDCGDEIPEARRRAVPGCRRCIDCQTFHENWRPL